MNYSKLLFFLLLAGTAASQEISKPQKSYLSEQHQLALLAGGAFLVGQLISDDLPFLATTCKDFSYALGINLVAQAFLQKKSNFPGNKQPLIKILAQTSFPLLLSAAAPLLFSYIAHSHPPCIGHTAMWQTVATWLMPKPFSPINWKYVFGSYTALQAYSFLENSYNTQAATLRLSHQTIEHMAIENLLTILETTNQETVIVQFPDIRFAQTYYQQTNDAAVNPESIESENLHLPITVATARQTEFFKRWLQQKKTYLEQQQQSCNIAEQNFNYVMTMILAKSSCFTPFSTLSLTRLALASCAHQVIVNGKPHFRQWYKPEEYINITTQALLPTS